MPGHFGTLDTEDGADASTTSSANYGVFGTNGATTPPSGGGAGGAGVFGLTFSPGAAGVFGSNNDPNKGVGVQGNGAEAGISGFSVTGVGLRAHSSHSDACEAFAHDSAGNGVLAINDSTTAPPSGGSPKGNGILAVTTVPGAAGAFGSNNDPNKGVGVQGNGPEAGVSGFSQNGVGLRAHSNSGDGTQSFAHSSNHNGLLGLNDAKAPNSNPAGSAPAGNGVYGFTNVPNASGVCGAIDANNYQGAGITGIGSTAGRFFGNVVVTGDLTVAGIAFSTLLQRIAALEAGGGHDGTPPDQTGKPNISASFDKNKALNVTGSGFLPSHAVIVRLVRDADATSNSGTYTSDASGNIGLTEPSYLVSVSGEKVDISATDSRPDKSDATGVLWSNTVTLTVP